MNPFNYFRGDKPKHIGLVLSGGGTRGIAHIGVIKAMREYGIEADFIAGTSAGSIIGSMYAAGISVEKMMAFFHDANLFSYRNYSIRKPGLLNSENYRRIFENVIPQRDFSELNKKLYIAVTNLVTGRGEIWHEGPLIDAIIASSSFPGIFSPLQVGSNLYADGGITNNFPIEPILWKCDFIIGSYANPLKKNEAHEFKNTLHVLDRAFHIAMFTMEAPNFHHADIFIMPEKLSGYKTFSLKFIDEIMAIGYEEAKTQLEANRKLFGS